MFSTIMLLTFGQSLTCWLTFWAGEGSHRVIHEPDKYFLSSQWLKFAKIQIKPESPSKTIFLLVDILLVSYLLFSISCILIHRHWKHQNSASQPSFCSAKNAMNRLDRQNSDQSIHKISVCVLKSNLSFMDAVIFAEFLDCFYIDWLRWPISMVIMVSTLSVIVIRTDVNRY